LEIAAAAVRTACLNERFEFVHLNGSGYGDAIALPTEDQARRCVAHWRQDTDASPPAVDSLCPGVPRLLFPTLALGIYLPFQVYDALRPRNTWLGDRLLMALEEEGVALEEIPDAYYNRSLDSGANSWRLAAAQLELLKHAEQACDVKPSAFMVRRMYRERLFWDFDHAAPPTISWLLQDLIRLTWPDDAPLRAQAEAALAGPDPCMLAPYPWQAPIGRMVREQLELDWVGPDTLYSWYGDSLTEGDYLIRYVAERRALRAAL
jgi:hypothetical protein